MSAATERNDADELPLGAPRTHSPAIERVLRRAAMALPSKLARGEGWPPAWAPYARRELVQPALVDIANELVRARVHSMYDTDTTRDIDAWLELYGWQGHPAWTGQAQEQGR